MKNNIYLIGFMGSGKSTIGQALASKLRYSWVDLDHYIESSQKMTIKEIFERHGESYFRNLERVSLQELTHQKNIVVSTGGGVVVTPQNVEWLKKQKTLYLKWDFETLFHRVAHDENRPLVKSYHQLLELYNARQELYEMACCEVIFGEHKSILNIINEIISYMEASDENSCNQRT